MAASLKFDVGEISELCKKTRTLRDNLGDLDRKLREQVDKLRSSWETPAGKVFFSSVDFDWSDEVREYLAALDVLHGMLLYAKDRYQEVEDMASTIKYYE